MNYYCRARKSVPTEVRQQLLSFVKRTGSRSSATGALNVLVEAGDISEFEALDRLDDWKMKWMYGGDIREDAKDYFERNGIPWWKGAETSTDVPISGSGGGIPVPKA